MMLRRHFVLASAAAGGALVPTLSAWAQPVEGKDFVLLEPPQPVTQPGKVEVMEFFTYACPHCSAFEPTLEEWAKQLPPDVVLRRVPVFFLPNAENFARTYFTLESMKLVDSMQRKIFFAVHVDKQRLDKPEDIAALVAKNGGDGAKFLAVFKSFSVATAVARAKKTVADYKVESVPAIVVQGRYVTSPAQAGGQQQTVAVVDQLIQRARKA